MRNHNLYDLVCWSNSEHCNYGIIISYRNDYEDIVNEDNEDWHTYTVCWNDGVITEYTDSDIEDMKQDLQTRIDNA